MGKIVDWVNNFFGDQFHKRVFFICLIVSIGLIVVSFLTPPKWIIDASVLAATGELFGFAALAEVVAAIERGKNAKIQKGDTSIMIGDIKPNHRGFQREEHFDDYQDA